MRIRPMRIKCPYCSSPEKISSECSIRVGFFYRKSDARRVQRFYCRVSNKNFSRATGHPCFAQKKRHLNPKLFVHFSSCLSQRRAAKAFNISRTTVARKFLFLGFKAKAELSLPHRVKTIEFDDLETFEHTKYKPLSVTLAVESKTRRILGFEVAKMPAKGLLAKPSLQKYGPRYDERKEARRRLLARLAHLNPEVIKSDENPHYPSDVKEFFPHAAHLVFAGKRGSITGQGELKKTRFDPLFSLNHTCAMLRANVNRLLRKTWCTTKVPERLALHLAIYANYHNNYLIDSS